MIEAQNINSQTIEPLKKKHPGGRPPITLKNLPKNWKEVVFQMAAQGMSDVEIRYELCVTGKGKSTRFNVSLWEALKKREPEFLDTIKISKELCYAWWLKQGRDNLKAQHFQTGLWTQNMKNRFGWRDQPVEEQQEELINETLEFKDIPENGEGLHRFKQFIRS